MLLPHSDREPLALVSAIVLLAINLAGTSLFVVYARGVLALQAGSAVHLPVTKAAPRAAVSASQLRVKVTEDGTIIVEGSPVALESLAAAIKARAPERVLVEAAQQARYPRVKAILQELGKAGVKNVTFSIKAND